MFSISEVIKNKLYLSGVIPLKTTKFKGKILRIGNFSDYKGLIQEADYIINIEDKADVDIKNYLPISYKLIDSWIKNGDKVLVHCAAGISRSATIVINYLMKKNNMSYDSAFNFLKKKRDIIDPNIGFVYTLMYEKY